jgi:hypothetical protein
MADDRRASRPAALHPARVIGAHPAARDDRTMSTTQQNQRSPEQDVSGWAWGGIAFAATMAVLIGTFQIMEGLVAIINDEFYVVARNYTFDLDVSAWGWIHLIVGIVMLVAGFGLYARSTWAGVFAIVIAALSAVANFFFVPYYPIWALLLIGLNVWIIWSLTRPGAIRT